MQEKLEFTYGCYTEEEIKDMLKNFDDTYLPVKLVKFASEESTPQKMFEDLLLKTDKTDACALTTYYTKHRRDFVKCFKQGIKKIKAQKAFEKKNVRAPFVGQRLESCFGYDMTIWEYYTVVRVSKKSVWVKADETDIFPKVMCRRIKWNGDHDKWYCRIDDVRTAEPWDGIKRENDYND